MNRREKEPLFWIRVVQVLMELVILGLIIVWLIAKPPAGVIGSVIFLMAAVDNFLGATVYFSAQKRVRGNICAILSTIFLIVGIVLAVWYVWLI